MAAPLIYLDMDGVVVNHFSSIFKLFGKELVEKDWPPGKTLAKEVLGIAPKEFKQAIIDGGEKFWAEMPAYPWQKTFWEELNIRGQVFYLSSPEYGPGCVAGKLRWIEAIHGSGFDRFIFTTHKTLLAQPEAILIDDSPKNIDSFIAAGGRGVLFERPWNTLAPDTDPANKALQQLDALLASIALT